VGGWSVGVDDLVERDEGDLAGGVDVEAGGFGFDLGQARRRRSLRNRRSLELR